MEWRQKRVTFVWPNVIFWASSLLRCLFWLVWWRTHRSTPGLINIRRTHSINKFVAKQASGQNKANGCFFLFHQMLGSMNSSAKRSPNQFEKKWPTQAFQSKSTHTGVVLVQTNWNMRTRGTWSHVPASLGHNQRYAFISLLLRRASNLITSC